MKHLTLEEFINHATPTTELEQELLRRLEMVSAEASQLNTAVERLEDELEEAQHELRTLKDSMHVSTPEEEHYQ